MLLLTSVMCFVPFAFSCHHVILVRKSCPTRLRFYWCSGFWVVPWVIFLVKVVHDPDLETLAGFCKDRELQEGGKWRTTSIHHPFECLIPYFPISDEFVRKWRKLQDLVTLKPNVVSWHLMASNPVLAWIYTIYCSQNYMEITPFAEFPIENLPFDKVPFLSPTNGWVWSLLVKGFSPEGSRKRYAMVKLQYASSTEGHLVGTVYFKKQIPKFSFLYTMMKTCDISIP